MDQQRTIATNVTSSISKFRDPVKETIDILQGCDYVSSPAFVLMVYFLEVMYNA